MFDLVVARWLSRSSQHSLNQLPANRKPPFAHERAVAWPNVEIGGARTLISGRHVFSSNGFFVQFMGPDPNWSHSHESPLRRQAGPTPSFLQRIGQRSRERKGRAEARRAE
jgi:hypothetical protein